MDLLYVGTHGKVRALEPDSGREAWTTSLPGTGYDVVTLLLDQGRLFAGSRGKVFCLDPEDGRIQWENALRGLGYDLMTLATARATTSPIISIAERAARTAQHTAHIP